MSRVYSMGQRQALLLEIAGRVDRGQAIPDAVRASGISLATYYKWRKRRTKRENAALRGIPDAEALRDVGDDIDVDQRPVGATTREDPDVRPPCHFPLPDQVQDVLDRHHWTHRSVYTEDLGDPLREHYAHRDGHVHMKGELPAGFAGSNDVINGRKTEAIDERRLAFSVLYVAGFRGNRLVNRMKRIGYEYSLATYNNDRRAWVRRNEMESHD